MKDNKVVKYFLRKSLCMQIFSVDGSVLLVERAVGVRILVSDYINSYGRR